MRSNWNWNEVTITSLVKGAGLHTCRVGLSFSVNKRREAEGFLEL